MKRSASEAAKAVERYNANQEKVERAEARLRKLYAERDRLRKVCFARLPLEDYGIVMGERFELSCWSGDSAAV